MEQTKETQGLNIMEYPSLDSGKEEKHQEKIWRNLKGVFQSVQFSHSVVSYSL